MCTNYDPAKCPTVSEMLARLGDKWSVLVIMMLRDGPKRFSELKRQVVGISQRMLTLTLRALERDGMVRRTVYATIPPSVEYELTDLGRSFSEPIEAMGSWVFGNYQLINAARQAYDARQEEASQDAKLIRAV